MAKRKTGHMLKALLVRASALLQALFFPAHEKTHAWRRIAPARLHALYAPRQHARHPWIMVLYPYRAPEVRALMWALKFRGARGACASFFPPLVAVPPPLITPPEDKTPVLLIPVPLCPARLRTRGFNQSALLAHALHRALPEMHWTVREDLLTRKHSGPPQSRLPRMQRMHNVSGAFHVRHAEALAGAHVIVVDDIATTGATLREARRALLAAGARSVHALAFAG